MGLPMDSNFDDSDVEVTGRVRDRIVPAGVLTFWVRGRDEHRNWGPSSPRTIDVNGEATVGVGDDGPMSFALEQNAPNPVSGAGTAIRYALPRRESGVDGGSVGPSRVRIVRG